ncbi:phage portal protein [Agromyces larvae]|uniref:Phage portal protein n=1 Tax=Agromyces larvae TaxID=2929802 RepID=A0ABY4BX24_9MICO|nr:phage portal protein [Agromyces larvae]UOE43740.1 phage portal protein [Agromyces larvae]
MGIFNGFRFASGVAGSNVVPFPKRPSMGIVSPWTDNTGVLEQLVAKDILGVTLPTVTRAQAMKVPAVVKARALLHAVIATRPLRAYRGDELRPEPEQPTWLYRSDSYIAPRLRTKLILDDLIFDEASLLRVTRGAENAILDAVHVDYSRWEVDETGIISIDKQPVDRDEVIWIPGPGPGLRRIAADTIDAALSTEAAWKQRVRNPFPAMVIFQEEDVQLEPEEVKDMVDSVAAARRSIDAAVMFVPYGNRIESHAADTTDLFESGRNAIRIDFANFFNMPTALLDGSVAEASLTYSTQEGRRNDFLDLTVPYWSGPIEDALSLDNVVPRGQRVRFDFSDLITPTASPAGPTVED